MRVDRTFAFVDLCGFTAFTEEHTDEDAVRVLTSFRTALREIASSQGVRVAKWLGDGAMMVGVEPAALVAAMLELEQWLDRAMLPLALRTGMTRGQVILVDGEDYVGHAVNLAARLCDVAEAHELLATEELAEFASPWGEVVERAPRAVPGFHGAVEVVNLRPVSDARAEEPTAR